jgi:glycosyltransferase involved in cell wall biosynthesis
LHIQKNFPLLISAVKHIAAENPDIRLEIYGDGDEKKALEVLIAQQNLSLVCSLMGRTVDVERVLKGTDLFIMSSDYEGMPNALIEALAMGVPCISSDCRTGPKSLVKEGKTGLLFETGNLDSLTEKLTWALQHPDQMNQMGKAAREDVLDTYRIEKTMSSFLEMMDGICGKNV